MTTNTVNSSVYPMLIQKYNTLIPDPNANVLDKINTIIDYLNQTGKLTNDVVNQWNQVMAWAMNDGLNTDVRNKINSMVTAGTFPTIKSGSAPPSVNADFIGQTFVDSTNKIGYLSIQTGTGSADWKQITN